MTFAGLRVLSFESRRATEMAELIRRQLGDPFVAPSMRELPLESNDEAFSFAERLFRGDFDMMILLTGAGTRALAKVLSVRYPADAFPEALRKLTVVARGPKPASALREMNVPIAILVPEPNTWHELLHALRDRPERRIAIQEYGRSNIGLIDALKGRGAEVVTVRVYQWDLPEEQEPLREAVRRLAAGNFDVALFTTSVQVPHLFRIAAELGLEQQIAQALHRVVVGSIGPTTTEALQEYGIQPDIVPSHPKMGFLVKETASQFAAILDAKQGR
ncbi:MAG TPA: uroporphyrinogen-III synthase [Bryobacteraceae bacterium]|nr:uroporphyrinogen-III synthase [Bryobacteraceae bacterium]